MWHQLFLGVLALQSTKPVFRRGNNLLQVGDNAVTARQVVNVLGRYNVSEDWDTIGKAGKMDDFNSGDYYEDDVQDFATDFSKGTAFYVPRSPRRRNFCKTHGLVQRWVHNENVGLLPFSDEMLAASVGATVEELNSEPVDPLAAEIVFDALSRSMSGVVYQTDCDAQRESFVTADGSFDEEAFSRALAESRRTIAGSLLIFPGLWIGVVLALVIRWGPLALEAFRNGQFSTNISSMDTSSLLLPVVVLATFVLSNVKDRISCAEDAGSRRLSYRERAVLKADELYLERMRRKKRGEKDDGVGYIDINQAGAGYANSVRQRFGMQIKK